MFYSLPTARRGATPFLCLFAFFLLAHPLFAQLAPESPYVYQRQFGSGDQGKMQFDRITTTAVDAQGNIYGADAMSGGIIKMSPDGQVLLRITDFDGLGTGRYPVNAIALDAQGNIYASLFYGGNNTLCKFSPGGKLLLRFGDTGDWSEWYTQISGMAVDPAGNVYACDVANHNVKKYSPTGQFLARIGTYGAADGQLNSPNDVCADAAGNLYVSDAGNSRVQQFSASGQFLASFGSPGSGDGNFQGTGGIATGQDGVVYVADPGNERIQRFSPAGEFLGATPLPPVPGVFYAPNAAAGDLALDGVSNLYVIRGEEGLFKYSPAGQFLRVLTVSASADGLFTMAEGVAVDAAGNVYVSDTFKGSVQKLSPTGQFLFRFGTDHWGFSNLLAYDITVDGEGSLYTLDYITAQIKKFSSSGQELFVLEGWMIPDPIPSSTWATALATDRAGNLYATEAAGGRIHKFSPAGQFLESIPLEGVNYGDYVHLTDLAVDGEGNFYVADASYARVRKYSPAGQLLQSIGAPGSADGQFQELQGIAVDARGNVFVADGRQNRVQKFSPDGRFVEAFGSTGYGNGQFMGARDLVVDAQYNVYVADFGNNRVQKFAPQTPDIAVAHGGADLVNGLGSIRFGTVLPGQSASQTIAVTNTGTAPLVLQALTLPAGFSTAAGLPATVPPGSSLNLTLSFAPAAAGSYAGVAEILSNDADESPFRLDVSGTARKADQTIAFTPLPDQTLSSPAFPLGAVASSGLPVSYTSSNPAVATVSGHTVTVTGPGQAVITAEQAGDTHYNPAAPVAQTLTVLAPPVITRFSPASARPGEAVLVEGTAFAGTSAVTFALSASGKHLVASFTLLSDEKLSVVVPAGAAADETARIVVQTPGGTATSTGVFTFYPAVPPGLAFYRALNLNGEALTLDGNAWAGKTAPNYATNGENLANPSAALVPATTAVRTAMLRSAVSRHTNLKLTLDAVPAGTYQVYLYVWEDKKNETYSILLEGKVVQANYNSGAAGTWRKLGPFEANITDGTISLATTGGAVNFSGVEVWRVTTPAARTTAAAETEAAAVRLYPNPVRDRLTMALPFPADQVEATALTDAAGAVRLQDAHVAAGPRELHFDVAALPAGLYLLRIDAGTERRVTRFVKR